MQLERIRSIPMRHLRLQVRRKVDNIDCLKWTSTSSQQSVIQFIKFSSITIVVWYDVTRCDAYVCGNRSMKSEGGENHLLFNTDTTTDTQKL